VIFHSQECFDLLTSQRYVKVINEDGVSVTITVVTKQLCYIPIMSRLKRLFLSKETTKQMR
jgi:hypothetical protein